MFICTCGGHDSDRIRFNRCHKLLIMTAGSGAHWSVDFQGYSQELSSRIINWARTGATNHDNEMRVDVSSVTQTQIQAASKQVRKRKDDSKINQFLFVRFEAIGETEQNQIDNTKPLIDLFDVFLTQLVSLFDWTYRWLTSPIDDALFLPLNCCYA